MRHLATATDLTQAIEQENPTPCCVGHVRATSRATATMSATWSRQYLTAHRALAPTPPKAPEGLGRVLRVSVPGRLPRGIALLAPPERGWGRTGEMLDSGGGPLRPVSGRGGVQRSALRPRRAFVLAMLRTRLPLSRVPVPRRPASNRVTSPGRLPLPALGTGAARGAVAARPSLDAARGPPGSAPWPRRGRPAARGPARG